MAVPRYLALSEIKIGEPDANSEYFSALRTNSTPVFLDCFLSLPQFSINEFMTGEKYIIYGQKGTGKTSLLRHIERETSGESESEFIIFKKAFLEEIDLTEYGKLPLMVDEEDIKRFKHFHHTVKRLLVLIVLSKSLSKSCVIDDDDIKDEAAKSLIRRAAESAVGDVIKLGMDSITSIFQSLNIDLAKLTHGAALIEGGKIIKRNNDDILSFAIKRLKKHPKKIRIFLDEIHFAYRSEESLQQDAILVRDTILAVQSLNERFSQEGIDAIVYIAVRAEYLEHPIISTADINHAVESVGHELTWSTFPLNKDHPLFDLVLLRFQKSIGPHFKKSDLFKVYLDNIDPQIFLERTWSKPRDFVRFFKCARKMYPTKASLSLAESNAVWRNYSQEAWREIKSSASPFMPPEALSRFEETIARVAPDLFDKSKIFNVDSFGSLFRPVYESAKSGHKNFYSFEHFLRLLYILGIFATRRKDALEQDIYHSYHRGNRNYHANGEVLVHPTVLKAFG